MSIVIIIRAIAMGFFLFDSASVGHTLPNSKLDGFTTRSGARLKNVSNSPTRIRVISLWWCSVVISCAKIVKKILFDARNAYLASRIYKTKISQSVFALAHDKC